MEGFEDERRGREDGGNEGVISLECLAFDSSFMFPLFCFCSFLLCSVLLKLHNDCRLTMWYYASDGGVN